MSSDHPLWSVPVNVDEIPEAGSHHELTADAPTREAVARAAGLHNIAGLEAVFDLNRRGDGVAVKGEVRARVGQTCVVTLEPIENDVGELVDLLFAPMTEAKLTREHQDDPPEPLENGVVDLGAIATEFLMLGLDPYPRKPGAELAAAPVERKGESPFAALARLRKPR